MCFLRLPDRLLFTADASGPGTASSDISLLMRECDTEKFYFLPKVNKDQKRKQRRRQRPAAHSDGGRTGTSEQNTFMRDKAGEIQTCQASFLALDIQV